MKVVEMVAKSAKVDKQVATYTNFHHTYSRSGYLLARWDSFQPTRIVHWYEQSGKEEVLETSIILFLEVMIVYISRLSSTNASRSLTLTAKMWHGSSRTDCQVCWPKIWLHVKILVNKKSLSLTIPWHGSCRNDCQDYLGRQTRHL